MKLNSFEVTKIEVYRISFYLNHCKKAASHSPAVYSTFKDHLFIYILSTLEKMFLQIWNWLTQPRLNFSNLTVTNCHLNRSSMGHSILLKGSSLHNKRAYSKQNLDVVKKVSLAWFYKIFTCRKKPLERSCFFAKNWSG